MDRRRIPSILFSGKESILWVRTPRHSVHTARRAIPAFKLAVFLFTAVLLLAGCGQKKSADNTPPAAPPKPAPVAPPPLLTVARVHWIGLNQISHDTNAARLMAVWNLPESLKLEQQTLDKGSFAPWRLLHRTLDTNAAGLLRPLLDDVISNESCLEICRATNQPAQLAFAIRLDDPRAALWQTNLARVLESLTSLQPVPAPDHQYGWSLKKHHAPDFLELTRAGNWTIFGAAQASNSLVSEIKSRIQQGQAPLPTAHTNDWLEADLNPSRLAHTFSLSARTAGGEGRGEVGSKNNFALNHLHLAITSNGTNVLTRGTADFSKPLALDIKPWDIPTTLIDDPLSSLTVVRGFKPWLESSKFWQDLQIGPAPDQLCFWGMKAFPMESYFSAPLSGASNEVARLADLVLQKQNAWYPTNKSLKGLAKFARSIQFNGLEWKGLPYMKPFVRSITISHQSYICGGGLQNVQTNPTPHQLPAEILGRTNLVYYDWENTGARLDQWLYMSQFARFVMGKAELPTHALSTLWIKAAPPKLGETVTEITQTGPSQLSFTRTSTIGFTAVELNLLADWLESPQFPIGLHTFLAEPAPLGAK